jgi:hypothetical protein
MRMNHLIAIGLTIFIPCRASAQERPRLPQGPAGTVTLPVADYDRLIDRAAQVPAPAAPPPVAAVVSRADRRATVVGDVARGTLRLDGETFEHGHVKVPLVTGATLLEARADGRPLPLLREGEAHAAVLQGPASFSITLDWAVPLSPAPGRASFTLPVPAGGTVSASLDLPGDPADVRVEPGLITRRPSAAGRTTFDLTLEPGKRATVSWSVRDNTTASVPSVTRTLADVKSLVTIGDADIRLVALIDVTVVSGEPRTFEVRLPQGFDVSSVSGSSLETSATREGAMTFTVRDPSRRRHQFLISLEQTRADGSFKIDTSFPTVAGVQREIGETAIEATATVDVAASANQDVRRMDVRETHASLRALARQPLLAAFRYQKRADEARVLTLEVTRFADAPVIAAAAERAVATSLVTVDGRMLTEVQLTVRNRAQPFMKVTLPAGATMLSVEVAGEAAKPVTASDGTRVPLLRAGFRADRPYTVSFVYLHAGEAFAKKGDARMILPAMDLPVSVLEWELFLPDRFSAKAAGGNVIPARLIDGMSGIETVEGSRTGSGHGVGGGAASSTSRIIAPGQVIGRITDISGAVLPGVTVHARGSNGAEQSVITDGDGRYTLSNVPSGTVHVRAELAGFKASEQTFSFDQRPRQLDLQLAVGAVQETVTVQAQATVIDQMEKRDLDESPQAPSQNVMNLQRRVSGVLPVRIDVPRTGTLHRFVRPLVLDEETSVVFKYKRR